MDRRSGTSMKIAELSRRSATHRSTIHHYLDLGLLPPPETVGPKLHLFGDHHLTRLQEIRALRSEGLGLAAIRVRLAARAARQPTRRPPPRRRVAAPTDSRAALLDAAARLFLDRGFDGAGVQAIARAAGVSKATLYEHFAGKRELFIECIDRLRFTLVPAEARAAFTEAIPLLDEARARAGAVLTHFDAYRTMTNLLGVAARGREPAVASRAREALHRMITNAEPALRRAIDAGALRPMDSELLAYMLWGALFALGDRLALDDRYTADEVLATYLEFLRRGAAP